MATWRSQISVSVKRVWDSDRKPARFVEHRSFSHRRWAIYFLLFFRLQFSYLFKVFRFFGDQRMNFWPKNSGWSNLVKINQYYDKKLIILLLTKVYQKLIDVIIDKIVSKIDQYYFWQSAFNVAGSDGNFLHTISRLVGTWCAYIWNVGRWGEKFWLYFDFHFSTFQLFYRIFCSNGPYQAGLWCHPGSVPAGKFFIFLPKSCGRNLLNNPHNPHFGKSWFSPF